jgi:hypothetical protein
VKGIDEDDIGRGDILCNNLNYCQESSEFKANITILELPEQKKLLSSGYECVMHMHAIANQVEIVKVEAKIEKETGKKVVSTFLRAGEKGICVFKVQMSLFRLKSLYAWRNTILCLAWEDLLFETKESTFDFIPELSDTVKLQASSRPRSFSRSRKISCLEKRRHCNQFNKELPKFQFPNNDLDLYKTQLNYI